MNEKLLKAIKKGSTSGIEKSLEGGASANSSDKAGTPVLHLVIQSKDFNIGQTVYLIDLLLDKGATINSRDSDNNTALHHAVQFDNGLKIAKKLVERGVWIKQKNDGGKTAHSIASENEYGDIEKFIAEQEKLFSAIKKGDVKKIKKYLKKCVNVNATNTLGTPILHLVVKSSLYIEETNQMIDLLIGKGVNINSKDSSGNTALHHAAGFEFGLKMVQHLVGKGARLTAKNKDDATAQDIAIDNERTDTEKWLFKEEMIYRQTRAECRFFEASRVKEAKKTTFGELKKAFVAQRKQKDAEPIDAKNISGRKMIMADGDALKDLVVYPDSKADFQKNLVEKKKWYNGGYKSKSKKINMAWAYERVKFRWENGKYPEDKKTELVINSQYQPVWGHQGNFRMAGIGDYGSEEGEILDAIYEVTRKEKTDKSEKDEEKKLANLMLECIKNGIPITSDHLVRENLYRYKGKSKKDAENRFRVIGRLNRVLFLTGIKEVTRRMHGSDITLPFATAYVQGLKLVSAGHLKMKDLFGKNAPYGMPTASSLTASHVASAAKEKLRKLNARYVEKFGEEDTVYSREYFHKLLRDDGYGGGDLTDGAEYETSDDEEHPTP